MEVFSLLGITQGDAIKVDNPRTSSGIREVIPLALSKNGISIRAIDCRYGDIRYVAADWNIYMEDGSYKKLGDFPYISKKLKEWHSQEKAKFSNKTIENEKAKLDDIKREFASLDEILETLKLQDLMVAVTGTLPIPREEMKSLLQSKGAKVMGSVSKKTSYLFMGNTGRFEVTSKIQKAHDNGVKIITL